MNGELLEFSPGSEVQANTMFLRSPIWKHEQEHFPGTWAGLPMLPQCIPDSWLSPASAVSLNTALEWHVPGLPGLCLLQLQSFHQSGPRVGAPETPWLCLLQLWAFLQGNPSVGLPDCYLLQLQLACQSCLDPYIGVTPSRPGEVAVLSHSQKQTHKVK